MNPSDKKKNRSIQKRNANIIKVVGVCVAVVLGFGSGVLVRGKSDVLTARGF